MSGERFTDEEMRAIAREGIHGVDDNDCPCECHRCRGIRAIAAECSTHRASTLTAPEREALVYLRACIVERDGEYALDLRGTELTTALDALTKLTQEPR